MFMRRRPLLGAAVIGGVAYHVGKKGAQAQQAEADQNQQIADLQAQQAQQQYQQAPAPVAAAAPAAGGGITEQLTQLKGLLDSGVLTQDEFAGPRPRSSRAAEPAGSAEKGSTMGPIQVLVVGFGPDAQFTGKALDELKRLTAADVVRLVDLLFVRKNADGRVEKIEVTDAVELADLGALAGGLLGLGEEAGAEALAEQGSVFTDEQVWYLGDDLPPGDIVAIAVLEHTWAAPLATP